MKKSLLALIAALSLIACNPPEKSNIEPEFDRSGQTMRVKMIFHDNLGELQRAKVKAVGGEIEPNLLGWAGWNNQTNYCEIHALRPKRIDDQRTLTIGHEFLHCVYGRYHNE